MTPEQRMIVLAMIDKLKSQAITWPPNSETRRLLTENIDALDALLAAPTEARAEAYKDAARVCRAMRAEWMHRSDYALAIERAAEAAKDRA